MRVLLTLMVVMLTLLCPASGCRKPEPEKLPVVEKPPAPAPTPAPVPREVLVKQELERFRVALQDGDAAVRLRDCPIRGVFHKSLG